MILDVIEYEPDADMIFNYLMVSALASATDIIEREGLKPSGGMYNMIYIYHVALRNILDYPSDKWYKKFCKLHLMPGNQREESLILKWILYQRYPLGQDRRI